MRQRRGLRSALISAGAGVACLALATPAWATVARPAHQAIGPVIAAPGNPPGANGTVKIDGKLPDSGNANEPHVPCEFQVDFFNFDNGEEANLVFTAQPPTGSGTELLRLDKKLISDDDAGGANGDPDLSYPFTVADLHLESYPIHEQQGYHIKLTVERLAHPAGTTKHKVFWIEPCAGDGDGSDDGGDGGDDGDDGGDDGDGGGNGGGGDGGSLPVTGAAAGGIALAGLGLIGGGVALVILRRRRNITFTA